MSKFTLIAKPREDENESGQWKIKGCWLTFKLGMKLCLYHWRNGEVAALSAEVSNEHQSSSKLNLSLSNILANTEGESKSGKQKLLTMGSSVQACAACRDA